MHTAAGTLRPGGRLVVVDMHPLAQMLESIDPLVIDSPYADDGPHRCRSSGTYADPSAVISATETVQWAHSVGEITPPSPGRSPSGTYGTLPTRQVP